MDCNEIRIAVPSNDGKNVFEKMLGLAKYFYIYKADKVKQVFFFVEKRINPYQNTQQHLKTLDVYEIIKDCQIILSAHIGKKGIERLQTKGVELAFNKGNIQTALQKVMKDA